MSGTEWGVGATPEWGTQEHPEWGTTPPAAEPEPEGDTPPPPPPFDWSTIFHGLPAGTGAGDTAPQTTPAPAQP